MRSDKTLASNQRGHDPIAPLGVELGLWQGTYQNQTQLWLRWRDEQRNLLLIGDERAQTIREAIPRLLAMGLRSVQVAQALNVSVEAVEMINDE